MTDSIKLPWMKFHPNDWRVETSLRVCSLAARGLWIEMLTVMHTATPRGSLTMNDRQMTPRQLAALVGATVKEVETLLQELEEAGVFSRDDGGTIYSRRMKRDEGQAARDKENGKKGGNPNLKPGVNPSPGKTVKARVRVRVRDSDSDSESKKERKKLPAGVPNNAPADADAPPPKVEAGTNLIPFVPRPAPDAQPNLLAAVEPPIKPKTATRLDAGWKPSAAGQAFAREKLGPVLAVETFAFFRDHWTSETGRGTIKRDWEAAWRNWVRREIKFAGRGPQKPQQQLTKL